MRILSDKKILDALYCPICRAALSTENKSLVCNGIKKHCFDFGGGGYVNFGTPMQSGGGDTKEAVRARTAFLNSGYYAPVAEALAKKVSELVDEDGVIIDAGCGEGYYAEHIVKCGYSVFGADLSKFAVDSASKRMNAQNIENAFFAVSSVFALPVNDGAASAVINVFAPCAEAEYSRVLKNGGYLFVVSAGQEHLWGLKKALYSQVHENTERADMPSCMKRIDELKISFDISVQGKENVQALFAMTPYYWRTSRADAQKLELLETLDTKIDIDITVYKNVLTEKELI